MESHGRDYKQHCPEDRGNTYFKILFKRAN
jgi:hypothetical protein